jgi:2-hydroxy-3-oxopropionate reductase
METVGYVGLGLMGKPMALNLVGAGVPLVVHNRSQASVQELAQAGAVPATSYAEVATQADVIFTCLPDLATVEQVIAGPDGLLAHAQPGTLIVDMSTISPMLARDLAQKAMAVGCRFLDAPVSGGEVGAREATLSIMVGGEAEDVERARPFFEIMGQRVVHVGAAGAGQIAKACNQTIVAITIEAVSEALLLARQAGVDPARVREALMGGFAQSRVLDLHGQRMIDHNFVPGGKARHQLKDLDIIAEASDTYGAPMPFARAVQHLFAQLVEQGDGDLDHSALYRLLEQQLDA